MSNLSADTSERHKRVLVVEDDDGVREAVVAGLEDAGFATSGVRDGLAAFAWMDAQGAPNAIILDLVMPGMDGWEFLDELQEDEELARVSVVVLTATSRDLPRHVSALIQKPGSIEAILEALEAAMGPGRERDTRPQAWRRSPNA